MEWAIMRRHPLDGVKILYENDRALDLAAAVAYEHPIMINGQGYPRRHFARGVHAASRRVHVCDVYAVLRTNRPSGGVWESEPVLTRIEEASGTDFDAHSANAFTARMKSWDVRLAVVDDEAPLPVGAGAREAAMPISGGGASA